MGLSTTVAIEVTPPGSPDTRPWWTVLCDGTSTTVRSAPGLQEQQPSCADT